LTAGRVVVVGLGPAGTDLILPAARRAIARIPNRFVRTTRHPAIDDLAAEGIAFHSFDHVYDAAATIDEVYPAIVDALVEAAERDDEVLYAVPGNPAVAERSVALLRARDDVAVDVIPGMSFAELAWSRAGIDPMAAGARVADAAHLVVPPGGGPLLIAQADSSLRLSDVKLTLLEDLEPDTPVLVLRHLGLADEALDEVPLRDLDRVVDVDHLSALLVHVRASRFVGSATAVGIAMERFVALTEQLRGPGGCPWDAEQTHRSLARYALEEAYEVVEAIEQLPPGAPESGVEPDRYHALEEELGDLLYQVVFHATLAAEAGAFTIVDVVTGIHDKLVRRHPHVFGEVDARDSTEVLRNWEEIKREEKGRASLLAGLDPALPALLYAHKLLGKGASLGLEPPSAAEASARVEAALDELRAGAGPDPEARLGELLAAVVALARSMGVDGETALRGWATRLRERLEAAEAEGGAGSEGVRTSGASND
jgi:tetrapyrrole methylase family protein/MazG family protein